MTIQRMEHVGIVVDDLAAAKAFFVELGLELQGEGSVEGGWVDRIVGLEGVRAEIAMLETPDGHGRLELTEVSRPVRPGRRPARAGEHPGHPPCRIRSRRHRRCRRQLASPRRGARRRGGALRRQLSALLRPRPGGDHRRAGGADRLRLRPAANRLASVSGRPGAGSAYGTPTTPVVRSDAGVTNRSWQALAVEEKQKRRRARAGDCSRRHSTGLSPCTGGPPPPWLRMNPPLVRFDHGQGQEGWPQAGRRRGKPRPVRDNGAVPQEGQREAQPSH